MFSIAAVTGSILGFNFRRFVSGPLEFPPTQVSTPLGLCGGSEVPSTISQEQAGDDLVKLNSHKSVEPDDVYLKVLRELTDVVSMFGSH